MFTHHVERHPIWSPALGRGDLRSSQENILLLVEYGNLLVQPSYPRK